MTLQIKRILVAVQVHACAKFHQAKCGGSQIIMLREETKTTRNLGQSITWVCL